ncbi:MAG: 3-hydroxyacyl-CoA dehydrogenase family protein [Ginsengibacter sp.]
MNILFIGEPGQMEEIKSMKEKASTALSFENLLPENVEKFNAIFFLNKNDFSKDDSKLCDKFILINDVSGNLPTSSSIKIARFNGWPTFLKNNVWEVATNYPEEFKSIFTALNREVLFVNDEPGLISARVVSRIINEAFYALNEGVSTKEGIDLAMKNGTNYPFGPFEWAKKIGLEKVHILLSKLSEKDNSYSPAFTL